MRKHEVVSDRLIQDGQEFVSAKGKFDYAIRTYDDGFGRLFIHQDSMGISGIVRAVSPEVAYEICEDEFFPEAGDTLEEMEKEYSTIYKSGRELWFYETGESWEIWKALPDTEKNAIYQARGKDVPFDSSGGGFTNHPCWQEAYGFRPNGPNVRDKIEHGIYARDLNGDALDLLTRKMVDDLEITLEITGEPYARG